MNWMSKFASRQRRSAFKKSYVSRLLPIIIKIRQQRSACNAHERLRAVKSAVDMSLALTADQGMGEVGIRWRRALRKQLLCRKRSRNKSLLQSQRFRTCLLFARKSASLTRSIRKEGAFYHRFLAEKQKMNTLRLLIPGGAAMNSACLLKEASCYIVALEMQVEALQAIAKTMQNFKFQQT